MREEQGAKFSQAKNVYLSRIMMRNFSKFEKTYCNVLATEIAPLHFQFSVKKDSLRKVYFFMSRMEFDSKVVIKGSNDSRWAKLVPPTNLSRRKNV